MATTGWLGSLLSAYEVDPLECPSCKGPMRVIALIDDPDVIRRILSHLGLWRPPQHGPPGRRTAGAPANVLTYHPVPDIA